ncbi:ribulose-phosphate 3-epimerase [Caldimicrobium thiodismutans]|uniref:Ribulose-phosphate 3-epimerase n=1 Tax=Caldimicrobium thiodismutans TaxID=1653476 RepID=A0A0U4W401_9BACT|nr:ribulose-phosphate 3-epimerase [Caldimicrobium thiodismutans]BAU23819.1 ribulose-phosphate 3-epimerase [Caldimicrobium thiodismutans]
MPISLPSDRPLIAPSILSADFSCLGEEVNSVEKAGAHLLHLDIMDGLFVPNLTFGPLVISALRPHTSLPFDVHLMIIHPERYIKDFAEAGADLICIHAEATPHLHRAITQIKEQEKLAGVSLNPHTPLEVLDYVLDLLDFVLIMTVNPGFGGQKFIPQCLPKIERLKNILIKRGLPTLIEVDGGINSKTALSVLQAGADILVAGSAIFGQEDYQKAISALKSPT